MQAAQTDSAERRMMWTAGLAANLENVLPQQIRDRLWPYLTDRRVVRQAPRTRREIVDELRGQSSSDDDGHDDRSRA